MAKQGMHHGDVRDSDVSRGHNNPDKSTPITTGTPKKKSTYAKQAREHKNTAKQAQDQKNEWENHTPQHTVRPEPRSAHHPGSESNEDSGTRGF